MALREKIILMTGATGPVGQPVADAFVSAGATLALCVRPQTEAAAKSPMTDENQHSLVVPCDLRNEHDVIRMVHRVVQRFGRVDVVINAASIVGLMAPIVDYPYDRWRDVLSTNLTGAYLVCREVLPWMLRQKSGSIINVTIAPATNIRAEGGALQVSAAGIDGLSRLLAAEVEGSGVRVNTVEVLPPGHGVQPSANDATPGWTDVFLWLADENSTDTSGKRLLATDFSPDR